MTRRVISWLGFAALVGLLAVAGYWLLFTTFMVYDDEGYVLISLKNFSLHGGLYDQVFSQYGPFPYLFYDALHRICGFAFTNTGGRWITLVYWMGTASACAILTARITRSAIWAAFSLTGVFTYLWVLTREPIHPGGLISFLVAIGILLGSEAWQAGNPVRFAAVTAGIGAVLALTKINVGIFFGGSAFLWLALNTRPAKTARILVWISAAGCAFLPYLLMHTLWADTWVRIFAFVFAGGALGILMASRSLAQPVAGGRVWAWFFGTVTVVGGVILFLTLLRGTSVFELVDGIILEPLRHPGVYFFRVDWRAGTAALAATLLVLAAWSARAGWSARPWFRNTVAAGRLLTALLFFASPVGLVSTSLAAWGMCYGISTAWLMVHPVHDNDSGAPVRAWLALTLVFQSLHAYPVAGSQMNWGTYLFVPLLALGLHDAGPVFLSWLRPRLRALRYVGSAAVLLVSGIMVQKLWARVQVRIQSDFLPLQLPGAENIRLPENFVTGIHVLDENLRAHVDTVFSLPGIYSVNLWTGLPTPTLMNATHWFSLLNTDRQNAIIASLEADPRAGVVMQHDVINALSDGDFPIDGPLFQWIVTHYHSVLAIDSYDLWLRQGRTIAPLSSAQLSIKDDTAVLALTFRSSGQTLKAVDLRQIFDPHGLLLHLDAANTAFVVQPIDLSGDPVGSPIEGLPSSLPKGIVRVSASFPRQLLPFSTRQNTLILPLAADGSRLAEIRLVN